MEGRSSKLMCMLALRVSINRSTRLLNSPRSGRHATRRTSSSGANGKDNQREYEFDADNFRSAFSTAEKKDYIKAVQCIAQLPPKFPKSVCPGCQNRFDDFVATHIRQTFSIHNTGNFLPWHRYFTYAYEKTLRDECGYKGYQPYYNWPRWSDDPTKSPLLDGSETSLGGNGVLGCTNQTTYGIPTNAAPLINIPHGSGGGCIASGTTKDWSVNLGKNSGIICVCQAPTN